MRSIISLSAAFLLGIAALPSVSAQPLPSMLDTPLTGEVLERWCGMTPEQRAAVREQAQ